MSYEKTLISRSNKKSKLPLFLGCSALFVLLVVIALLGGYFYTTANASGQSVVSIRSPQNGDVLVAGEPVQVSALARDDDNVTRIELWIDNVLVDVQESTIPGGINPFPLLSTWYPTEGSHTLIIRAFDGRNNDFQATIYVGATAFADRDADGIADDVDACPDQPGSEAAEGCPDRDFDGVTDATDACPDEAGLPPTGCPEASAGDRDGDGMLDSADLCPDEVGSPLADGCPDADGDGTPDSTDACPGEPGAGADGCPEPEGSLPPDPAPGGGDAPPEARPGDDPPDPADDEEPETSDGPVPFDSGAPISIEIQAYEFQVLDDYENMWCYVRLGEEDPRRYDFEPEGENFWNIAEELSGENSVRILHEENLPLNLSMECHGSRDGEEPVALGEVSTLHPPGEWDGREFRRGPFAGGLPLYSVRYRICTPSCDESALPAPLLAPPGFGPTGNGPYRIGWRWDGDESLIDGFNFRVFNDAGETLSWSFIENPEARFLNIEDYMPACGETNYFEIYARAPGGIRSPMSNTQHWVGDTCTYSGTVMFTTLDVHNPPADEQGLHRPGPVYGNFWVSNGTEIEFLNFNACWCYTGPGMTFWGWCEGLELQQGTYAINRDIFEWIHRAKSSCIGEGCRSNAFYAPHSAALHFDFQDDDDLTIGGHIMDCDAKNADDLVFEEQGGIRLDVDAIDSLYLPFGLNGDHIDLNTIINLSP